MERVLLGGHFVDGDFGTGMSRAREEDDGGHCNEQDDADLLGGLRDVVSSLLEVSDLLVDEELVFFFEFVGHVGDDGLEHDDSFV